MKPQLARHYFEEADKRQPAFKGKPYMVFEKYDGWYGYYDAGTDDIMSRAGRPIPSVKHLVDSLKSLDLKGRLIFEILVQGVREFHKLNGMLNRKTEPCLNAYLVIHDWVFDLSMPFKDRWKNICCFIDFSESIQLAQPIDITENVLMWQYHAEQVWSKGGEGVILKDLDGVYCPSKRNATMMKIKEEVTLDLLVVGTTEGEGKYTNTLGSILCKDKSGHVHSISGMNDDERKKWYGAPSYIVGKVVEVKAMKKLKDGSLREPRYKAVRHDKAEEDID